MLAQSTRKPLAAQPHDPKIIDRMYQIEAVRRVCELFDPKPGQRKGRKSLLVQATGTGKTRTAIALCKVLVEAGWAKRVLFLCDRRELRKQAYNAFGQHLKECPRIYLSKATVNDTENRIFLATYPAMQKVFTAFDPGFFDVIVVDESHRSIFNYYRQLLQYFDGFQIGLTATPRSVIGKNTYKLFDCENDDPTCHYEYKEAIGHTPPYLSHFKVVDVTTKFLREGIKWSAMTDEQKRQLEEQVDAAEDVDHEAPEVDRAIFNRDTNKTILRNLMEHGLRNGDGTRVGKSIIFARNHRHAALLGQLFDELYPQYGGKFCAVIDI